MNRRLAYYLPGAFILTMVLLLCTLPARAMDSAFPQAGYVLAFNGNGGTGAPDSVTHNGSVRIPTQIPRRDGYLFRGWSESRLATAGDYSIGLTYTIPYSTTLYAIWEHFSAEVEQPDPCSPDLRVSWDVLSDSSYVLIYRCPGDADPNNSANWLSQTPAIRVPLNEYIDMSTVTERSYYYRVQMFTRQFNAMSEILVAHCHLLPPPSIYAEFNEAGKPVLHWEAAPKAGSYWIYRATPRQLVNGSITWDFVRIASDITDTVFVDETAETGKEYRYGVETASSKGNQYNSLGRAEITVQCKEVPVSIITQPRSVTVAKGAVATFSVEAGGSDLSYQWQYSTDKGASWKNWSGKTQALATVTAGANNNGVRYRVIVSNSLGSKTSASATLTLKPDKPVITAQPQAVTVANGAKASFKVTASGTGLSYQWYYSSDKGATWKIWSGKTSAGVSVTGTDGNNGVLYRCKVTNGGGSVTSSSARLTVKPAKPVITTQPKSVSVSKGSKASFKVVASGTGLSYQWYYSSDNGSSWKLWSGKTSAGVTVTATANNSGVLYRCRVTNGGGSVTSSSARLTVK